MDFGQKRNDETAGFHLYFSESSVQPNILGKPASLQRLSAGVGGPRRPAIISLNDESSAPFPLLLFGAVLSSVSDYRAA